MSVGDATYQLYKAIVAALKANAGVTAIVGQRVFDTPSPTAEKPYISLGPADSAVVYASDAANEWEGSDIAFQLDGWSTQQSSSEIFRLGAAVREALHEAALSLQDGQRLVLLEMDRNRYMKEPDGITKRVVISGRALTEPTV